MYVCWQLLPSAHIATLLLLHGSSVTAAKGMKATSTEFDHVPDSSYRQIKKIEYRGKLEHVQIGKDMIASNMETSSSCLHGN